MPKEKRQMKKTAKEEKKQLQSPKGMHDILPREQPWWEKIRRATKEVADFYSFTRIDTTIVESADVFERTVGEATDIVEKQMFMLKTKGDKLVLRPEGTASIVRAYLQHGLSHVAQPLKVYYRGPFFRYEQPQAGRYRQFHQLGFEIIGGEDDPMHDAQIMLVTVRLIEELKIKNAIVQLNSIGCAQCRVNYRKKLQEYYRTRQNKICKDCKRRLSVNPLRLLDCKQKDCTELRARAPVTMDYLCHACRSHFKGVLEYLDELALPYIIDNFLVRGLDYYNRTVFEVGVEGMSNAIGGGGRYDKLGEYLTGKKTPLPAVGSSLGMERLVEIMKSQQINGYMPQRAKVFLVQMGDSAKKKAITVIEDFRKAGVKISEALGKESLKTQLRIADKEQVQLALILGQREVFEESIIIRDMKTGAQETVPLPKVVEQVKKRLR